MWLGLWHTEVFLHQNVLVCSLWLREGHRDQNGGGGCECFPGELQGVPVSDRRGCLSCLQPGCCLLMLAAEAPDEVGELCRSQKCKRRPYVRYRCQVRSSSAVGAGSEQEGPRVNWGGAGTSYITHTLNREGPSALSRSASSSLAHLGGCLSQPIPRAETCRKDQSQAPKRPTHRR